MNIEDKQKELLNRHYTNVEGYKLLRIQIPLVICSLILGVAGFSIGNDKILVNSALVNSVIAILLIVGLFGIIVLRAVQIYYNDLANLIYYLYDELEMNGVKLLTRLTIGLLAGGGLLLWLGGPKENAITIAGVFALYGGGIAFVGLIVAIVIQSLRSPNK